MKKFIYISVCGLAIFAVALSSFICPTKAGTVNLFAKGPVINWGITPNTKEQTPGVPEWSETMLAENDGIYVGNTEEKKVYFTFDLGYEAGYTDQVLDILKENKIKGIFFLCGNYLKQNELINRMINEGHIIGNHTDRHKDLPKHTADGIKKDIVDFQLGFKEKFASAAPLKYFRPPFGRFDERTLQVAKAEGLKTMLWSIAIVDWGKTPIDAVKNAEKISGRIHPGAIILFHITNSGTPEMLKLLIPQFAEKGYSVGDPSVL